MQFTLVMKIIDRLSVVEVRVNRIGSNTYVIRIIKADEVVSLLCKNLE